MLAGEPVPLFVSSRPKWFTVTAYRLGWYQGAARGRSGARPTLRGGAQRRSPWTAPTSTVTTNWDPVLDIPTHDWPAGAYLLRLDADSGAQRYVPLTIRSPGTAGAVVLKSSVPDLAGLQHLGRV